MSRARITHRYAKSLMDLAIERNELDQAFEGMQVVLDACKENRELRVVLQSPLVSADQKSKILADIFKDIAPMVLQFIEVVVRKKREPLLQQIANDLITMYKVHNNIRSYSVTTASPLNDELRTKVRKIIDEQGRGGTVELEEKLDPKIIGGFVIRLGDQLYDASLRSRFNDLRSEFSKNPYIADF
jgi:F-type H+-transporting ATPase subunit delta